MTHDTLTIRAYNVRFGDAFLISVPDDRGQDDPPPAAGEPADKIMRHILIDVGNALTKPGGSDEVFEPVVKDILQHLNGSPVDLYIMTHEHMDHIQGLLAANKKHGLTVNARYSWLTGSAAPDYYTRDWPDEAIPKKALQFQADSESTVDDMFDYVTALQADGEDPEPALMGMLNINNYRRSKDNVDYLRERAPEDKTAYMYRGYENEDGEKVGPSSIDESHPFNSVKLEVWAPEENTADYYGRFRPRTLGFDGDAEPGIGDRKPVEPTPPPGVDASAFYRLVNARKNNLVENLLAIDKAKNNSSIVFCLEWAGWRFLFPGDAQTRSWQIMEREEMFKPPIHFLKISHHLSHNGTPEGEILDEILFTEPDDGRKRLAVASTYPFTYNGIPFNDIIHRLDERDVKTYIIADELDDIQTDKETPVPYRPGYLAFTYKDDGSDPTVEIVPIVI